MKRTGFFIFQFDALFSAEGAYLPPGGRWIFRPDEGGTKKTDEERRDVGHCRKPVITHKPQDFCPHFSSDLASLGHLPPGEGIGAVSASGAIEQHDKLQFHV